jgi:hypothetical protein
MCLRAKMTTTSTNFKIDVWSEKGSGLYRLRLDGFNYLRKISKAIVAYAHAHCRAIAMEDLSGITAKGSKIAELFEPEKP